MIDSRFKECLDRRKKGKPVIRELWSDAATGGVLYKAVLKNFPIFTSGSLFPKRFLKRDSNTGVFL